MNRRAAAWAALLTCFLGGCAGGNGSNSSGSPSPDTGTKQTPASGPLPLVAWCDPNTNSPVSHPGGITIACGDGGVNVTNIDWTSWSQTSATGSGDLQVNTCTPDCASGAIDSYPGSRVALTQPVTSGGVRTFSCVTITSPAASGVQTTPICGVGNWGPA
jgi:hypothetical protein